jgi:hypothetical protein
MTLKDGDRFERGVHHSAKREKVKTKTITIYPSVEALWKELAKEEGVSCSQYLEYLLKKEYYEGMKKI